MEHSREAVVLKLNRDELKRVIGSLGLSGVDRRSQQSMQLALLGQPALSVESILRALAATIGNEPRSRPDARATSAARAKSSAPAARSSVKPGTDSHVGGPFVAIDFETADRGRDSACAVAIVRVEGETIQSRVVRLIRPPRRAFEFTYIHGIRWSDVAREPAFGAVWTDLMPALEGAAFIVAHNASFDRSVLETCCRTSAIAPPSLPFECTVKWARKTWDLYPTNLPAVCKHLNLALKHHDAGSDAEACARIMIAARKARAQKS